MLPSIILAGLLAVTASGPAKGQKMDEYSAFGVCRKSVDTVVKILDMSMRGLAFDEAILMLSTIDTGDPQFRDVLEVTVQAIYRKNPRMTSLIEAGQWSNGCVLAMTEGGPS